MTPQAFSCGAQRTAFGPSGDALSSLCTMCNGVGQGIAVVVEGA